MCAKHRIDYTRRQVNVPGGDKVLKDARTTEKRGKFLKQDQNFYPRVNFLKRKIFKKFWLHCVFCETLTGNWLRWRTKRKKKKNQRTKGHKMIICVIIEHINTQVLTNTPKKNNRSVSYDYKDPFIRHGESQYSTCACWLYAFAQGSARARSRYVSRPPSEIRFLIWWRFFQPSFETRFIFRKYSCQPRPFQRRTDLGGSMLMWVPGDHICSTFIYEYMVNLPYLCWAEHKILYASGFAIHWHINRPKESTHIHTTRKADMDWDVIWCERDWMARYYDVVHFESWQRVRRRVMGTCAFLFVVLVIYGYEYLYL